MPAPRTLAATLLLAVTAPAQGDPGAVAAAELRSALAALGRGDAAMARAHLLRALVHEPESVPALGAMLRATADTPGIQRLWAHAYSAAAADSRGRFRVEREHRDAFPVEDRQVAAVAAAKAAAARELAAAAAELARRSGPARLALPDHLAELLDVVTDGAPALRAEHRAAVAAARARLEPPIDEAVAALRRALDSARAAGDDAKAMRAARILRGLGQQARDGDLQGPPAPALGGVGDGAAGAVEEARRRLLDAAGEPLTVAALEAMTPAERRAFDATHADPGRPAVARSLTGRYRIETHCGHDVLLAAARTIELHHERLAGWYGKDPFADREGHVVIVPDRQGLEAEGAPYWWAGGFQRGDRTVVHVACATVEQIGRVLTHELTHRFDGVLAPFQPTWLVEGKAVWTAGAYRTWEDLEFLPMWIEPASFGSVVEKGYGRADRLSALLRGEVEYRDHYSAGFALYCFVTTWHDGERMPFAAAAERFFDGVRRSRRDPVRWFEDCFCDGEDGRPADLEAFAADFETFLRGFGGPRPAEWTARYRRFRGGGRKGEYAYGARTWVYDRRRTEPWFGQDHASSAGALLAELGDDAGAAHAFDWALFVDEWPPHRAAAFAALLERAGAPAAAWVIGRRATPPDQPCPALAAWPKTRQLLGALRSAAERHGADGAEPLPAAAAGLAAAHDRLAALVGAARLGQPAPLPAAERLHEWLLRERLLRGFAEAELAGHDRERGRGLFAQSERGDLVVGRDRAAPTTGVAREAPRSEVFVRAAEWQWAGSYRVRGRVFLESSWLEGALVVGHTRRDRWLRVTFSAGDSGIADGRREGEAEIGTVTLGVDAAYVRDAHLAGAAPVTAWMPDTPRRSFELEVIVDGPSLRVLIDGERMLDYTTPDALPIEGHVGFATERGAMRVQAPTVTRLDCGLEPAPGALPVLDLDVDGGLPLDETTGRPVRGLPPHPDGTLLLLVPPRPGDGESDLLTLRSIRALGTAVAGRDLRQALVVAFPPDARSPLRDLEELARTAIGAGTVVRPHRRASMREQLPVIAFVDGHGVVRTVMPFPPASDKELGGTLAHWAAAYHEAGR